MLDLPTFLLIIGIGNLSFAGLMATYARGQAAQPGLRKWMWARVTLGLCQLASVANLRIESAMLGQAIALAWIGGMALEIAAYCLFFQFARWRRILYPAMGLAMSALFIAPFLGASVPQMVPLISMVVALFAGAMGAILLWPRSGTPVLQRIIGMNDAVLALAVLAWVWTSTGQEGPPSMGSAMVQSVAFIAGYILMIVKGFGFLLLCKQEDDRKMLHLATIDSLTGLLNRHAFFEQALARRAQPAGAAAMTLLMLDLDHFKQINDRFGHAGGDTALRQFSHAMQTVLAGRGILGRLGGEEFALALAVPLHEGLQLAEQLRLAAAAAPLATGGEPFVVTVSIGVASLQLGEAVDAGLARADHALYDAKRAGRNCIASWQTPSGAGLVLGNGNPAQPVRPVNQGANIMYPSFAK